MKRPVICLTPILNEAANLERFIKAASLWADHIIIADQMSTDGSRDICAQFNNVCVIENRHEGYDEASRQELLLGKAREISKDAVLVALDADEFLTANFHFEPEWTTFLSAQPGTAGYFNWHQVMPGMTRAWTSERMPLAFVDDGSSHDRKRQLHSLRLPIGETANPFHFNRVGVLHYHYIDWDVMLAKIRFYQCLERSKFPEKSGIKIYRFYQKHIYIEAQAQPMPTDWLDHYGASGIDMTSLMKTSPEHWNRKTFEIINEHGLNAFKDLAIWDIDWATVAKIEGHADTEAYRDPRSRITKRLHGYLFRTQFNPWRSQVRKMDRWLMRLGF